MFHDWADTESMRNAFGTFARFESETDTDSSG